MTRKSGFLLFSYIIVYLIFQHSVRGICSKVIIEVYTVEVTLPHQLEKKITEIVNPPEKNKCDGNATKLGISEIEEAILLLEYILLALISTSIPWLRRGSLRH